MNTIGSDFSSGSTDGEYWNSNESFTNVLPTVTVTTPVQPAAPPAKANNTWLWIAGGIGALLFFGKKMK